MHPCTGERKKMPTRVCGGSRCLLGDVFVVPWRYHFLYYFNHAIRRVDVEVGFRLVILGHGVVGYLDPRHFTSHFCGDATFSDCCDHFSLSKCRLVEINAVCLSDCSGKSFCFRSSASQ